MKILIVGGAGYIGGHLTDYLLGDLADVTVYDSLIYEQRFLKDVPFIYGDIRDRDKLSKILPDFDVVIWLAAIVGDGACAIDPFFTQAVNEDSVKWFVDNYDGKIVFMSTCSVYGTNSELIDEDAPTNPLSIYASTKLAAEQYIVNNAKDFLIFRLGTLYGIGDCFSRIRFDLVVNVLTKKATLGEKLTVFGGNQWRPLLHVKDVASAVFHGLRSDITGLYNLAQGNHTILQIAEMIKCIIPDTVIECQDKEFEDLRNYKVNCDKFLETNWAASRTLGEGINEVHKLIIDHRIKNVDDPIYSNEFYINDHYFKL